MRSWKFVAIGVAIAVLVAVIVVVNLLEGLGASHVVILSKVGQPIP